MNSKSTKIFLYLPTMALGYGCMLLQDHILAHGYDEKGLLVTNNPAFWIQWIVTGVFLLTVLLLLPKLGEPGTYRMNFPKCAYSGGAMIAAGVLMAFCGINEMVPGAGVIIPLAGLAVSGVMVLCGLLRIMGRKPVWALDLLISMYYAAHLMKSYRTWNADPQLQRYAFQLLAGVAVMLFSLHRARCAQGLIDRRRLVFSGFAGIYLCFTAVSGAESPLFFAASALWCAGGMCELKRFRKKRKSAEIEPDVASGGSIEFTEASEPESEPEI